jgi:hypothetical protein
MKYGHAWVTCGLPQERQKSDCISGVGVGVGVSVGGAVEAPGDKPPNLLMQFGSQTNNNDESHIANNDNNEGNHRRRYTTKTYCSWFWV